MRWVMLWVVAAIFIAGGGISPAASRQSDVPLSGPAFTVGGLKFTVPSKWVSESPVNPARAGQWRIPAPHDQRGDAKCVVFFFGPGVGGNTKDNIEAWTGTMSTADGKPATADVKHHETGGLKITQVVLSGTYSETVPLPGIPPVSRTGYELMGVIIESPQGNIYWRFTGPELLITASLPLFSKIIDSVKPQDK